jgi:hypothetical protein
MDKPSGSNIIAKSQSAKAKIAKAFALEGSENHVCFTPSADIPSCSSDVR